MKRLFSGAGIVLMLTLFSCAQNDTKGPDTSGSLPRTEAGAGIDTSATPSGGTMNSTGTNNSSDGTNNNQTVNTGDSNMRKQ